MLTVRGYIGFEYSYNNKCALLPAHHCQRWSTPAAQENIFYSQTDLRIAQHQQSHSQYQST
jgi:hypothetical protein